MKEEEALLTQAGRRMDQMNRPEYELRARQTRLVASTRQPSFGTRDVYTEAPKSLLDYKVDERWSDLLEAGWRIGLIDLRGIVSMQPAVFMDVDIPDVDPDDLNALADITLRPPGEAGLDTQFDRTRNAWIILLRAPTSGSSKSSGPIPKKA